MEGIKEPPGMLTAQQAQVFLQVSRTKMYQMLHQANFPAIRIGRAIRVISREALLEWLRTQAGAGQGGRR